MKPRRMQEESPSTNRNVQLGSQKTTHPTSDRDQESSKLTNLLPSIISAPVIPGATKFGYSYMRDEKTRIDFILVYKEELSQSITRTQREFFLKGLTEAGLELETEASVVENSTLHFIKIHVPMSLIKEIAEITGMNVTFKKEYKRGKSIYQQLGGIVKYFEPKILEASNVFRTSYQENSLDFILTDDHFSNSDRIRIVWKILSETKYGDEEMEFGIEKLLSDKIFFAAYPLHDGNCMEDPPEGPPSTRRILYLEWVSARSFYKTQPLNTIKDYFGDEVALYFAWLSLYTTMLVYASILGISTFLYGVVTTSSVHMVPSNEICNSDLVLCPRCWNVSRCEFVHIRNSCVYSKVAHYFDNSATVFFAILMSFWGTLFMKRWKRKNSILAWQWDLARLDFQEELRPEYKKTTERLRYNYIFHRYEPYTPVPIQICRFAISILVCVLMIGTVLGTFIGIVVYRIKMSIYLEHSVSDNLLKSNRQLIVGSSAAFINVTAILIFEPIFKYVAKILTKLENPRTDVEFESLNIYKVYVFEFFNFYGSPIYVALFKGRFFTYPSDQNIWTDSEGLAADFCDPAGCFTELFLQLVITVVIKQFISNIWQVIRMKFIVLFRKCKSGQLLVENLPNWEKDFALAEYTSYTLFTAQLEMITQYGFVTMFVAAFPLAPLFALINNIIEIRLDAYKLLIETRRSVPRKVPGLGAWEGILGTITFLSIFFNASIIAFTSEFIPRFVYKLNHNNGLHGYINWSLSQFDTADYNQSGIEHATCRYRGFREPPSSPNKYQRSTIYWTVLSFRLLFIVVFAFVLFALSGIIGYAIPNIPRSVKQKMSMERSEAMQTRKKLLEVRRESKL